MINETGLKIIGCRIVHPEMTMANIGEYAGVTRERVRQILREYGLPTFIPKVFTCKVCGNQIPHNRKKSMLCRDCRFKECWVLKKCEMCEKEFHIRKSVYIAALTRNYKHTFCSNKCQGKWLGDNYGRGHKIGGQS